MESRAILSLAAVSAAAFLVLAVALGHGWDPAADAGLAARMYELVEDHRWSVDVLLDLGRAAGVAFVVLVLVVLVAAGRLSLAALLVVAVLGVGALEWLGKEAVRRPSLNAGDAGYSFPSGHAMAAVALAVLVVLVAGPRRRALVVGLAAAAVVGYCALIVSRGWHYPTDVIGGWLVTLAWLALLWLAAGSRLLRRESSPHTHGLLRRDRDRDRDTPR